MKLFVVAILAIASASAQSYFEDGKEVVFDTQVAASAGSMDYATHTSGFSYKCKTRVQFSGRRMNIQFENVQFSQYVGAHQANAWPFDTTKFTDAGPNPKPFAVELDSDGLFSKLIVDSGASIMERNLARSWASQLQINAGQIRAGKRGFKSNEQSLNGKCDVTYSVSPQSVRKTVSHTDDCEERVFRIVDDYRSMRCDGKSRKWGPGYPSSLATTIFNVEKDGDKFRMKSIITSGTWIAQFFEEEGAAQAVYTNQTSVVVDRKSSSGDISVSGGKTITELAYEWADQDYKWDQDRDLKAKEPFFATGEYYEDDVSKIKRVVKEGIMAQKTILQKLDKTDATIQKAHRAGINSILPAFMALDYSSLKSLADEMAGDKSEAGVSKFNVFGELLGSTGTTAAALVIKDLLLEDKFDNPRDSARILSAIPFHIRRPNTQLVKEFEPLLKKDFPRMVKQTVPLMFGHLIRVTCARAGFGADALEKKRCFKEFASGYVKKMYQRIESSSDRKEKGLVMAAMYNVRFGGQSQILKDLVWGKAGDADDTQLRVAALHTAGWEAIIMGNGLDFLLPVFTDRSVNHELRISALELIMHTKPSASVIANIAAALYREPNYEVVNYAFTLFTRWADSMDPCERETGQIVKYFLKYMKQYTGYENDWGFGVSKTRERQFHKFKYGYGGAYTYYTVGSTKSFAPIAFGAQMSTTMMNKHKTFLLGVHLRVEGLAKKIINKVKTTDAATWKLDDLKNILYGDMSIRERPDMPVRVQITVTLKNTIVFHRFYDDESAKPDGSVMKFLEQFKDLGESYKINHQRALQLGGFIYEQPTPVGIPLASISSVTTLSSLRATVKRGSNRGLLYRDIEYDINGFTQAMRATMVRHPARKVTFGIMNDRIYKMHKPGKIVAGVNVIKRELKLSVARPKYEHPMALFMHSQTVVVARGNNVKGEYNSLKENCPTCENRVIISRGPEYVKDRTFLDRDSSKYGYAIKGEYFNCEMDIRKKNTLKHMLGAFMPYNKSPKTPINSLIMGIRQIRAFFYYFPKNEQCGAQLRWSQSRTNPTTAIELRVTGGGEPNGEKFFFKGKKVTLKALLKAKGAEDRSYRLNLAYEFTPGNIENKFKLQLNRAPAPSLGIDEYSFCFALENKYPDFSNEFMAYDQNNDMKVTGKAMMQYGKAKSCSEADGEIRFTFEHSTTQEARDTLKEKWYYKQCMAEQNTPAWRGRNSLPVSEPCFMTLYDATSARKYTYDIQLTKVSDRLQRIAARVKSLAEAGLMPYWDADPEDGDDGSIGPYMNVDLQFKNDESTYDLKMETRRGTREYKDVATRLNWAGKLRNLKFDDGMRKLFYAKIINPCVLTSTDVRTADNATFAYKPSQCWTLSSAKCGPNPEYAVFTKRSAGLPLAARVYLGGHRVDLTPKGNSVEVSINGSPVSIANGASESKTEGGKELFKVFRWGSSYHVYSSMRVWVAYDGNFVEVIPPPSAFGQHCGICGNYNRNKFDEFTAKDMSQLSTADELVKNWEWQC